MRVNLVCFARARTMVCTMTIGMMAVMALVFAMPAQAAILSHIGTNAPAVEGWVPNDDPFLGGNSANVAPDITPSWQIQDVSTSQSAWYGNTFAVGDLPVGSPWVQTVEVRVDSSSGASAAFSFVHDGSTLFQFFFTTGELRYFDTGAGSAFLLNADNSTDFRTYEFAYDPVNDEIDISLDSVYQTSLASSAFFAFATTPGQGFGAPASSNTSDSRWAQVSFNVVPEPGTFAMLMGGGLGMLFLRKRRRA